MQSSFPSQAIAVGRITVLLLLLALVTGLLLRAGSASQLGRDWYGPGSFTLVNFDEAGSCRAALDAFPYSPFVGWQTLAIARLVDAPPPQGIRGDSARVKSYCHGPDHLFPARLYSALLGALTIVLLAMLGWQLFPATPAIGLFAAGLLALSGWHISESHSATVDAASTFFIYLLFVCGIWASRGGGWRWPLALAALGAAVATKFWVFALFAAVVWVPDRLFAMLLRGLNRRHLLRLMVAYALLFGLVCNPATPEPLRWVLPLCFYLFVPWRDAGTVARGTLVGLPWLAPLAMQWDLFVAFSAGGLEGRFGTDYGAIGWHKLLRNPINVPVVLAAGLGIPGFLLLLLGLKSLWRHGSGDRAWLVLLPLPIFVLYMLFLAPVTYYRHYLPLLPAACLLAAYGAFQLPSRARSGAIAVVLLWQTLLAWDLVSDYHRDPRRDLRDWFADQTPGRVLASYYAHPPRLPGLPQRLFLPRGGLADERALDNATFLILSENWYDTAYANELNGPLAHSPRHLVKTTPEAVSFYRLALKNQHPRLELAELLRPSTFMPELLLHRRFYGSFAQFVGDIAIFRVRHGR